ncbi:hypothetical protein O7605_13110 [Verrucosispora sp. WMMA2121]|uniref:hypothetical protein n=1 Tax=Verrucosispora sp. WMMA2121 TaxID=3015164 RepID=UPI0022B67803|nr:hypothetical protein [Verrucosispora sp. WMMA2121]MCZ7420454.1 hypothetical protein [Verrucosispora sp. WMMA2121]
MPASTRHHRTLAAIVHCVGLLTALPVLPTATAPHAPAVTAPHAPTAGLTPAAAAPEPSMPAAPPAVPTPTRVVAPAARPKVSVRVAPERSSAPGYRIEVRNAGSTPVETTVRQELPQGVSATTVSDGGRVLRPGGSSATEVTWRLRLAPESTTTLGTTLTMTGSRQPVTAPTCAYASDGRQPYDCASATWTAPGMAATQSPEATGWRRQTPALTAAGAALLVLAVVGLLAWRRRRRPVAAALASDGPGTVYPRPAAPRPPARRRKPPVWVVVPVAAIVLAGTLGAAAWSATRRVTAIDTDSQPTSGAWRGTGVSGSLGTPLREDAFEFTVYRMTCEPGRGARQCQATVGVRNLTREHQSWHGKLQRAYLANGNWVTTDEPATRQANQGRDVFADPLAAGSRVVLPLVFTVTGREAPQRLELRSGVFSAGVRVDVP